MLETSLKILKKICDNNFDAYIVGGFVRDYLLDVNSLDVDICTNATPKDLKIIFKDACLPHEDYGAITLLIKNIRFEITTFREELTYLNNRKPIEIKYIDNLYNDLLRRDFTINTICINKDGKVIDLLKAQEDLNNKIIKTVGNSCVKFQEDSLRILRAIRFATILNFKLSNDVYIAINKNKYLLNSLSYHRKKQELGKIFISNNRQVGINLLKEFDLLESLHLVNIDKIKSFTDIVGVWAILDVDNIYPFTNNEKELMIKIREVYNKKSIDNNTLYKYGLYISLIAGNLLGIKKEIINEQYLKLPIKNKYDIKITSKEICQILNKTPDSFIRDVYLDLENKILNKRLENEEKKIIDYIKGAYENK
ncbi:MAG: hypothetical protein RR359_00830 [Bacilli bacterium]